MPPLPHFRLPKVEIDLPRKKPKPHFPDKRSDGNRKEVGRKIIEEKDAIIEEFAKWRTNYGSRIKPALIFKIETNRGVSKKSIEGMGLKVLSIEGKNAVIVFSSDDHLNTFTEKIKQYAGIEEGHKYEFIDAFEGLSDIATDEKIGKRLKEEPLSTGEMGILDIEFWYYERGQMLQWKHDIERFLGDCGGGVLDEYWGKSFYVIRARVPHRVFGDIINMRQVSYVDRPPKMKLQIEKIRSYSAEDAKVIPPDEDALGILILDSGIMPGHPLLEEATGEHETFIDGKDSIDENGHGTNVAGVAIYGDLNECIEQDRFEPDAWIYSAKICDENGEFDEEKLLENQLRDAVDYFLEHYPSLKVVNISLGDDNHVVRDGMKQFRIAALIDEIIYEYRVERNRDVVFVISAGNCFDILYLNSDILGDYPHYLIDREDLKVSDPGTAANALTIGSISPGLGSAFESDNRVVAGYLGFPSPFTRTGPGVNGMLKPELVEIGGDMIHPKANWQMSDPSIGVVVTEKNFTTDGLFSIENGTSFVAPKVANIIAKVWKQHSDISPEMIKALVVNSAEIPNVQTTTQRLLHHGFERPQRLEDIKDAMKVYGYGIPSLKDALFSDTNRVLLLDDSEIGLDKIMLYEVPIPDEFYEVNGVREVSITLSYIPPTRRTRGDSYVGCSMEFRLFRGVDFEKIKAKYSSIPEEESDEGAVPEELQRYVIPMKPGIRERSKSTIQKAIWTIRGAPQKRDNSLKLVIICRDRWINDDNYKQRYSLIATVKHTKQIDLYHQIRQRIQLRERERIRV